jgi:3-oxoacyl-[acyl-carrier protein] reductase
MSAVRLIKAALPHLRQSDAGSILTITSVSVIKPIAGLLLSNVMRPAVAGLTRTLAQELASDNIRVNAILPGWTATDRVVHIFEDRAERNGTSVEAEQSGIVQTIPLARMAEPAEFGRVATFLVSPAASYVTGVLLPVDGGSTI